jgi:hypothetical protein
MPWFENKKFNTHTNLSLHRQPLKVRTAGAQAFLMDYLQGERAITHYAGPMRISANDCKYSRD